MACKWLILLLCIVLCSSSRFKNTCERTVYLEERSFIIHLPEQYCSGKILLNQPKIPVVFAVHGYGARPGMFSLIFGPYVNALNFALVQPIGTGKSLSFNGLHCCGEAVENKVDDVGFIKRIIQELSTWLPIDPQHGVVGTGFSNGGFLIEHSVLSGANLFSAIAPVGGHSYMYNQKSAILNITKPLPIFLQHATRDPVVKIEGCCATSRCCCKISERSPEECLSVSTIFEKWMQVNQCSSKGSEIEMSAVDGYTISSHCYSGINCRAPTKLCVHDNVLHAFPGRAKGPFPIESGQLSILLFLLQSVCEEAQGVWTSTIPGGSSANIYNLQVTSKMGTCRCKDSSSGLSSYCLK